MKNKIIASFMAAVMAMATFAIPAFAAVNLGGFPGFLGVTAAGVTSLDAYFVVGSTADPKDVAAAIDVAATAASVSAKSVTTSGTISVSGLDRDGISIGRASGGSSLATGGVSYSNAFPSGAVVKNAHFSGLKSATFSYKSNDYSYHEQVDVSGVNMRHDFGTSLINGTEKMEVQSGDVFYEYVFDNSLNITSILGTTTGTISNPEYTNPVNLWLLGKPFTIVGVGATSVKALTGSIGTADATTPVTYGDYSAYCTQGSDNSWAKVVVKDKSGNTVDTQIINKNDSKDITSAGLTIKVTAARALQDGTCVGADLVIGPTGTVEHEFDTSADVSSTGTSSDRFPGETKWGIQVASWGSGGPGLIPQGGKIQVVYKPDTTAYYKAGEQVSLPNNYGVLGFVGYGTSKFAKITVKPVSGLSAYNNTTDTSLLLGSLYGLEISTDVTGSILAQNGNTYDKAYVLLAPQQNSSTYQVLVGFYNNAKGKILASGVIVNSTTFNGVIPDEFAYYSVTAANNVTYPFKLSYSGAGEKSWYLNVTVSPNSNVNVWRSVTFGTSTGATNWANASFQNKTLWSTSQAPDSRLGDTGAASEQNELNTTTEATNYGIGKSSQDVVDDGGLIWISPDSSSGSDQVQFWFPSKDLTVHAFVGVPGGVTTTAGGAVMQVVPITSSVARLDTEVGAAEKAHNLVVVGGSCKNSITAAAMNLTFPTCGAASGVPENAALVKVIPDKFTTGKNVLVVAGWEADNTRMAAQVLQQYATLLAGSTATAVKVTAISAAGVTPM
ncbi:MAG: S-layer protein [Candidatus Aenigmarchaeota archaeon]|nr:S-layer protein [Candidatus Aenigmarchaeota archaeon]